MQANQRDVPNRLRELRKAHGLRLLDVAAVVDRDPSVINGYETGRVNLPLDSARLLAAKYGVTVEHLMGWDRKPTTGAAA